jgi:hypothetical protein
VVTRIVAKAAKPARIVHQVPGRIRIKVTGVKDDTEYFAVVRQLISELPGVEAVHVNATSSSIVVAYNPSDPVFHFHHLGQSDEVGAWLDFTDDAGLYAAMDDAITTGVHYLERHSRLAETVVSTAETWDARLRRASDGYLDLKMLLPLGVAAATSLHKTRSKGTPMWMTMGVFAFNAFLSLHRHRIDAAVVDIVAKRARHA